MMHHARAENRTRGFPPSQKKAQFKAQRAASSSFSGRQRSKTFFLVIFFMSAFAYVEEASVGEIVTES